MLASIEKIEGRNIACFRRQFKQPIETVWAVLTQNDQLQMWMPNLQVEDLRSGGTIKFNMNNGTGSAFDIKIRKCRENSILDYEWGNGWIRFELYPNTSGCLLVVKELINTMNEHTSKDLAGWHICLDMLIDLLNGKIHPEFSKENWKKRYDQYVILIKQADKRDK
ncbi:MAG: SRPBCC family protein [Sporolactobacillus sp.]